MAKIAPQNSITLPSFTTLHSVYRPMVRGVLSKFCRGESIEDLTQETFLEVYRSLDSLTVPRAVKYWIARIASRIGIRYSKNPCKKNELLDQIDGSNYSECYCASDCDLEQDFLMDEQARNLLAKLEPTERKIVSRIWIQGFTSDEVGAELGIPSSTVRTKLQSIRSVLQSLSQQEA